MENQEQQEVQTQEAQPAQQPAQKKWYKKWWVWVIIVLVLLILGGLSKPRPVSVSEADLNAKLAESVNQPGTNPLVSANIDLREDVGELSLVWEQGQSLTADIVVAQGGSVLVTDNVDFTGAGVFDEFFEGVANVLLTNLLTTLSVSQRTLVEIDINEDELVGYYSAR